MIITLSSPDNKIAVGKIRGQVPKQAGRTTNIYMLIILMRGDTLTYFF